MRVVKDANERKNEILDIAATLFAQKGFDGTTISDIIEKVGVARGTVYYHFKSKEDVMNALIERTSTELIAGAKAIADDKHIPVLERLFRALLSMRLENGSEMTGHMHKPQNALMHQKTHLAMLEGIPPILAGIVEDGVREGLFDTPYAYETIEMIVAYINTVFDEYAENLTEEGIVKRMQAFIFNLERLFGAKAGSLDPIMQMFNVDNGNGGGDE